MTSNPRKPIELPPLQEPARSSRKVFGAARTVARQFWFRPREALSLAEIRHNGRIIRNLSLLLKTGPAEPPEIFVDGERHLDMAATAKSHGIDEAMLRDVVARRRGQTARMAYLTFGIAWLIVGWWFWQAWSSRLTAGHMIVGLEFISFAGLFFLLAFKNAWQNWQLRRGQLGSAMEYLSTTEPFWPY